MRSGPCCRGVWRSEMTGPSENGLKLMTSSDATRRDVAVDGNTAGAPPAVRQSRHVSAVIDARSNRHQTAWSFPKTSTPAPPCSRPPTVSMMGTSVRQRRHTQAITQTTIPASVFLRIDLAADSYVITWRKLEGSHEGLEEDERGVGTDCGRGAALRHRIGNRQRGAIRPRNGRNSSAAQSSQAARSAQAPRP